MVGLFMTGMVGSTHAQIDVSKLITGNQGSPEAITSIHYGREGKLIWLFYHAPSVRTRHILTARVRSNPMAPYGASARMTQPSYIPTPIWTLGDWRCPR